MKEKLPNLHREMEVSCTFPFVSYHYLINDEGPLEESHTHDFVLKVCVDGHIGYDGFVMDFYDLDRIVNEKIISRLKNKVWNDIFDFNPSVEHVILWIAQELKTAFKEYDCEVIELSMWETPEYCATYRITQRQP